MNFIHNNHLVCLMLFFINQFRSHFAEVKLYSTSKPYNTFYNSTSDISMIGSTEREISMSTTKMPILKFKVRKRTNRKNLGDKCTTFRDCPLTSLCVGGFCSCPYDYYNYVPPSDTDMAVCRKKIKFGLHCSMSEDCLGYDSNSVCSDGICKCINGTHYIGSRNLLSYNKKCYRILEREGDICEIDEQCSRLADNHHKCRCVARCDCATISRYSGCGICHENIKRTFFGGAAFIVLLLSSRLFSKMRLRSSARRQRNMSSSGSRERCYRLNTSRTVPLPTLSYSRNHMRGNRRIAGSLPDVFLIETHHNLLGLHASNTTDFFPQRSAGRRLEDAPPSYEDIVGSDQLNWNAPPPSYQEISSSKGSSTPGAAVSPSGN